VPPEVGSHTIAIEAGHLDLIGIKAGRLIEEAAPVRLGRSLPECAAA